MSVIEQSEFTLTYGEERCNEPLVKILFDGYQCLSYCIYGMKVKFSKLQLDKLSDLSLGLGQLFFGSTVVPYIIPVIDRPPIVVLSLGLGFAIGLWIFAIWIVKK